MEWNSGRVFSAEWRNTMNQVICDICGSAYPETADRCPVCSYPRQGTEKLVDAGGAAAVDKVKGGRFSAKNVKKRRKAQEKAAAASAVEDETQEKNPNKPLWIVIILLLVAILLVSMYIGVRFFRGWQAYRGDMTTAGTTLPTETTVPPTIPCANISLEETVIALDEAGQTHQIALRLLPENTTDTLSFASSDPAVAQVSEDGLVTGLASGQAEISIVCGGVTKKCTVVCWFALETTVPPETTQSVQTEPAETEPAVLTLDPADASCFAKGEAFDIYVHMGGHSVSRSKVTWKTSDPKIATVENGRVTAVGKGTATITAAYEGQKAYCMVRCRFEDETEPTKEPETPKETEAAEWKVSHSDVSIVVGESFRLSVTNADGKKADAIWTMDREGVVSVDGKTVTGRAPGTVTLTTTVDGVTLTCIVRVK